MFHVEKIYIGEKAFYTYTIELPKTTLLIVANDIGYFSCRALDIPVFDAVPSLREREVVCGCASGVKTINELINAPLVKVTLGAKKLGIFEGMIVKEALMKLE